MDDRPDRTTWRVRLENRPPIEVFKDTVESLVIALILAFVFRAFIVEAFVIPTGSMADTLRGAHFKLTCPQCGNQYNYGFIPSDYGYPEGAVPSLPIQIVPARSHYPQNQIPICPYCKQSYPTSQSVRVCNGDRILVLKYVYQLFEPKRWDVVVFKNPTGPAIHYIKRLIGCPGDTVEIIDGDVYINGTIEKKPPAVQNVLWIPVYDNDYTYKKISSSSGDVAGWANAFQTDSPDGRWKIDSIHRKLIFNGSDTPETLSFDPDRMAFLLANFLPYNGPQINPDGIASDLKFSCILIPQTCDGSIAVEIEKYGRTYRAQVNMNGKCTLYDAFQDKILAETAVASLTPQLPVVLSFAMVDHRMVLTVGNNQIQYDGPNDPADWGYDPIAGSSVPPQLRIVGMGSAFELRHNQLFRDVHYTSHYYGSSEIGRGTQGRPFTLKKDEFFVLGDNSTNSFDSRFWDTPGKTNGGPPPRAGIVPREYMIGKAWFVYWPAGFKPNDNLRWPIIPNVGEMRFIQ